MTGSDSLPTTWAETRLEEVAEIILGQSPPGLSYNTDGIGLPLFQGSAEFGDLYPEIKKWTTKPTKFANAGDVLLSVRAPVGPTNLAPLDCAIGRGVAAIRAVDEIMPKYLLYALRATESALASKSTGTTFDAVPGAVVREHLIRLAPTAEQRRIVAAIEEQFSRIDAGVEALQRARRNLQRMRAAVLQAAVTGRLVPQHSEDEPAEIVLKRAGINPLRDTNFPSLPESWGWVRFGDLLRLLRNGIFVSRPTDDPRGIPILRISAVRPLQLDLEDVRYLPNRISPRDLQPFFIAAEDLLFTRYSGNPEFVGACAMVRRLPKPTLHPDKLIRAVVNKAIAVPSFLELVTSAGYPRDYIRRRRRTTAGQTGISGGDLKSMPVPLPPLAEQARIAQEVERQVSIIQALARAGEGSLERIASLRRRILSVAFQGRLVPQDPSDEAASNLIERIRATRAAEETKARLHRRMNR